VNGKTTTRKKNDVIFSVEWFRGSFIVLTMGAME
jgi:hypothetical protein